LPHSSVDKLPSKEVRYAVAQRTNGRLPVKKIPWGRVLLSGFIYTVIANVVHILEAFVTRSYYSMPEYAGVWSKLLMPHAGRPSPQFLALSLLFGLIVGMFLAFVYVAIKDVLPQPTWSCSFSYAGLVIGFELVLYILPVYLLFNVPVALLISWTISYSVIFLLASILFVRILDKKQVPARTKDTRWLS